MEKLEKEVVKNFITRYAYECGWQGSWSNDTWCEVRAIDEHGPLLFELHGYSGNRDGGPWSDDIESKLERASDEKLWQWFKTITLELAMREYQGTM